MRTAILTFVTILAVGLKAFSQIPVYREIHISKNNNGQIDFSKLDVLKSELEKADIVLLGRKNEPC